MTAEGTFPKSPGDIFYSSEANDFETKKHTQNTDTALGSQSENLDMNTHKIVGVTDPTTNQEAATKKYVDDNDTSNSGFGSTAGFQNTTSASYIDFTGASASITTDGSKVLVIVTAMIYPYTGGVLGYMRLSRDNETAVSVTTSYGTTAAGNHAVPVSVTWIDTPGAAAHTYEAQFKSNGVATVGLNNVAISVVEI